MAPSFLPISIVICWKLIHNIGIGGNRLIGHVYLCIKIMCCPNWKSYLVFRFLVLSIRYHGTNVQSCDYFDQSPLFSGHFFNALIDQVATYFFFKVICLFYVQYTVTAMIILLFEQQTIKNYITFSFNIMLFNFFL